ncbi:MAG: hypothetical protein QW270_04460 [Candidatus Bathyarchaeia archaeon]
MIHKRFMATIVVTVYFCSLWVLPQCQCQHSIFIDALISGRVNDSPLNGVGNATVNPLTGDIEGIIVFNEISDSFNPLSVSCTSILSLICSVFCDPDPVVVNLAWVFYPDNSIVAEASFNITYMGNRVGEVTQTGIFSELADNYWKWQTSLNGWYNGPTNLISSPGYNCLYRQPTAGMIEGTYNQEIYCSNGTKIETSVRRCYSYDSERTLPSDEHMIYTVLDVKYVNHVVTFKSRAIYEGAKVGGITIAVDRFGLLAPYIGLASTTLIAAAATTIYVKRFKRKKQKQ